MGKNFPACGLDYIDHITGEAVGGTESQAIGRACVWGSF